MKTRTLLNWICGLALLAAPLSAFSQDTAMNSAPSDEAPPPEAAEQSLENAPGKVVSTPATALNTYTNINLPPAVAEIVKLVQAGVDESVLLAYVTNSTTMFNLGSDDIVYLNDIGVPGSVVTAMIQRDQVLKANPELANTAQPPPATVPETQVANQAPTVTAPYTPPTQVADEAIASAPNEASTYFYDSLAPYGNWVQIEGYGLCWQPTAVVINSGWQPYCDHGHWVYSDCGWYWVSDYSWGWAPFHYGRWFHHARWGWCWAPDTVWGPSWVSWRYTDDYCGWAPLPPTACYRPGVGFTYYGRSVGVSFSFGLSFDHFIFVPTGHFCDYRPGRYRVERRNVTKIYNKTVVVNQVVTGKNNTIINKGVPVDHVARVSHTKIETMRIRETDNPGRVERGERFNRLDRTVAVYRPKLPTPTSETKFVGHGVPAASHQERVRNREVMPAYKPSFQPEGRNTIMRRDNNSPGFQNDRNDRNNRMDRNERNPVQPGNAVTPNRNDRSPRDLQNPNRSNDNNRNQSRNIILRGPDRSANREQVTPQATPPLTPAQTPDRSTRDNRGDRGDRDQGNWNRRSEFTPAPQTPAVTAPAVPRNQAQWNNPSSFRQPMPDRVQREDRTVTPPLTPIQREVQTRNSPWSSAPDNRERRSDMPQASPGFGRQQIITPHEAGEARSQPYVPSQPPVYRENRGGGNGVPGAGGRSSGNYDRNNGNGNDNGRNGGGGGGDRSNRRDR